MMLIIMGQSGAVQLLSKTKTIKNVNFCELSKFVSINLIFCDVLAKDFLIKLFYVDKKKKHVRYINSYVDRTVHTVMFKDYNDNFHSQKSQKLCI